MFETDGGAWRGWLCNFSYVVICNMRVIYSMTEKSPSCRVNKEGPEGLGLSPDREQPQLGSLDFVATASLLRGSCFKDLD